MAGRQPGHQKQPTNQVKGRTSVTDGSAPPGEIIPLYSRVVEHQGHAFAQAAEALAQSIRDAEVLEWEGCRDDAAALAEWAGFLIDPPDDEAERKRLALMMADQLRMMADDRTDWVNKEGDYAPVEDEEP
jgi:hypothetical protein